MEDPAITEALAGEGGAPDEVSAPSPADVAAVTPPKTFTQADVDRQVREALRAQRRQYANAETVVAEERLSEQLQREIEARADEVKLLQRQRLVVDLQNSLKLSDEDVHAFLDDPAASDEQITARAERLAQMERKRLSFGNVAPREGRTPEAAPPDEMTEFSNKLFGVNPELYY